MKGDIWKFPSSIICHRLPSKKTKHMTKFISLRLNLQNLNRIKTSHQIVSQMFRAVNLDKFHRNQLSHHQHPKKATPSRRNHACLPWYRLSSSFPHNLAVAQSSWSRFPGSCFCLSAKNFVFKKRIVFWYGLQTLTFFSQSTNKFSVLFYTIHQNSICQLSN